VEDWKHDVVPEFMDGHNIADWVDPDIERQLDELDREEDERMARATQEDLDAEDVRKNGKE
jgi:nucleolar GTP-binding protein